MKSIHSFYFRSTLVLFALALGLTAALAQEAAPNPDALAHFRKAKELLDAQRYADAKKEADLAATLDPNLQDAKLLQAVIAGRLADHPAPTATASATTGPAEPAAKSELLTPEQITRIRLIELDPKETGLTGSVDRKTLEDYWANVALKNTGGDRLTDTDRNNFLNPSNFTTQVFKLRDSGDPAYINKIKLTKDPANLVAFKQKVQPWLVQNCATCHAAPAANGFRISGTPNRAATDAEVYTNFYNLASYAKGDAQMLDRDHPENSLMLQYALPKKEAAFPHPGKAEIASKLAATSPVYKDLLKWLGTLTFPRPNYGIEFNLAAYNGPAATQPATEPTK